MNKDNNTVEVSPERLDDDSLTSDKNLNGNLIIQSEQLSPSTRYDANKGYLTFYVVIAALGMLQLGYMQSANN